jgi:hypothetical protein
MTSRSDMPWRPGMTTPGRITRTDYRSFEFSHMLDFHTAVKHGTKASNLTDRVKRYLEHRTDTDHRIESVDNTIVLEFKTLDDARMFVLSFNDVIDTYGVKFD